ncbi:MAG: glycosyltransferase [Thermoanaerobaculia bacterium]
MRVLYVTDTLHPRVNGVSTSIDIFRRELTRRGHEVWVLAPRYGDEPEEEGVVRVASWRAPLSPEDRLLKPRRALAAEPRLARHGFDVIHVQTPFTAFLVGRTLARRWRVPLLLTYHTDFEAYAAHYAPMLAAPVGALARWLARWQCRQVDVTVVPTPEVEAQLRGYGVGSNLAVVPTGLPVADFTAGDGGRFRRAMGIPDNVPVLGYVGRLAPEKNVDFLLEVFAEVRKRRPEARLLLAGEGPGKAALERRARALGVAWGIHWAGFLSRRQDLLDCYRAADVFVFASQTETQGLVLLEAMALGVPVVAVPAGGTRQILVPGQGALVATNDICEFTARVHTVLDDPALARELSHAGRQWVRRHWSSEATTDRLLDLYETLIETARIASTPRIAEASSAVHQPS